MFGHDRVIQPGAAEQATVHHRVQGLDPAVHHFRETGDVGNVFHCQAGLADRLGGPAGGKQLHVARSEGAGQVDQTGFVGNGQQGPAHGQQIGTHGGRRSKRSGAIL